MPKKYPPLTINEFKEILSTFSPKHIRSKGGHVVYVIFYKNRERSIVFQTHIDPVPCKVIKSTIKDLGISVEEFYSRSKSAERKRM